MAPILLVGPLSVFMDSLTEHDGDGDSRPRAAAASPHAAA